MKGFWTNFRRALAGTYSHGSLGYAKGAAYSSLLSFFPVLTTVTALLVQADAAAISRRITAALFKVAPPGVEELIRVQMIQRATHRVALSVFAIILALWAASGVMMSLMEGFQAAYQRKSRRGIVHGRTIALWLVLVSILPVVGASLLMIFGDKVETNVLRLLGVLDVGETVRGGVKFFSLLGRYATALGAMVCVTALLYKFGPDAGGGRHIWSGSLLATALWMIITLFFAWYVRNVANYNLIYGSIGAVVALCVWMYLLSLIAMVGCEFNVQLDKKK